jgi:hypothetical protein
MSEALVTNYDEIAELKGQLAELRKNKEREIRQLEVAIYDGKKEAGVLRQMLAELHEVNAELHKDAQRLDWIQFTDLTLHHWEKGDLWSRNGVYTIREFIDKEM